MNIELYFHSCSSNWISTIFGHKQSKIMKKRRRKWKQLKYDLKSNHITKNNTSKFFSSSAPSTNSFVSKVLSFELVNPHHEKKEVIEPNFSSWNIFLLRHKSLLFAEFQLGKSLHCRRLAVSQTKVGHS